MLTGLFVCRHVYQFSKVFVGEQTLSRSASSAALYSSSSRVAVTTASSTLPSHTCLVSRRAMTPDVPATSPTEATSVLLSRSLVRSPSSPVSCRECLPSPATLTGDRSSDEVRSVQFPNKPVTSVTDTYGQLQESQVCLQRFQDCVRQGYRSVYCMMHVQCLHVHNVVYAMAHTHTHTRLTALCPEPPGWAGTRKVKVASAELCSSLHR